jgi:outer membrane lipoprotein carrier protein
MAKTIHLLWGTLLWLLLGRVALADSTAELRQRLSRVNQFSAHIVQTVTDADSQVLQSNQGRVWLQRPARFRWEISAPEEMVVVSDGQTLWFYTPLMQQVTATQLSAALEKSPFLLISRNQPADWQRYQIQQQGDLFTLIPRQNSGLLQRFTLTVTRQGVIQQFSLLEREGQCSQFIVKKMQRRLIPEQQFIFKRPPGVILDDQR